jgi:hypothetical protein
LQQRAHPVAVGEAAARDFFVRRMRQTNPHIGMLHEMTGRLDHVGNGLEVQDGLTGRPKELPVFVSVFDQHASSGRWDFERSHRMAIAIGPPNKAKANRCTGDCLAKNIHRRVPTRDTFCFFETFPVPAVEAESETRVK